MAYELRENSGSFFKNQKKKTENHPDLTGSAMIDGKKYWVAIWNKTSGSGTKFWSMAFTEMDGVEERGSAPAPAQEAPAADEGMPF